MKAIRITVVKTAFHEDIARRYANPALGPCEVHPLGQSFVSHGAQKPEGFCDNAWKSLFDYVMTLAHGGSALHGDWMRDPRTVVASCNDGVRPVCFLLELAEAED